MKILVIGDIHFSFKHIKEGEEYIEKIVSIAHTQSPSFIVLLGDTLDTHEICHNATFKLVELIITLLSAIAPLFILIGNHDLIDHHQFQTNNHFFGPYKRWDNVNIIDKSTIKIIEDEETGNSKTFVFVPYVPKNLFLDALNTLVLEGETWELADCIFAHQEFKGGNLNENPNNSVPVISKNGDEWNEDYPPVISGHLHDSQIINGCVYYPGSSTQQSYSEKGKCVWIVDWSEDDIEMKDRITKIPINVRYKKLIKMGINDIQPNLKMINEESNKYSLKLELTGKSEEFAFFRKKGGIYAELRKKGIIFDFITTKDTKDLKDIENIDNLGSDATKENTKSPTLIKSFEHTFYDIVQTKGENIRNEYNYLFEDSKTNFIGL